MRKNNDLYKLLVFIQCDKKDGVKCRDFAIKKGYIPIVPSLLFETYDEHTSYVLLGKCDELLSFNTTYGKEVELASKRHMPLRNLNDEKF